jgi:hypothetical protein
MNLSTKNKVISTIKECWTTPDYRSINLWSQDNVVLASPYSITGPLNLNLSKYLVGPQEALSNPHIRQVNVMASPQSGKTLIAVCLLLHTIANSSLPTVWYQASDEMMDTVAVDQLMPLLKLCKPVNALISKRDKNAITKNRFTFPHMTVNLRSAKLKALQSVGYAVVIGDEVWLWEEGFIGEAKARTRSYADTCKIYFLSQGSFKGDPWCKEYEKGVEHDFGWLCPKCNKEQTYHWTKEREDGSCSGITWDKKAKVNGEWDFALVAKSVCLECHYCRHQLRDTPDERGYLNDTGRYIVTKANGDPTIHSFRWSEIANRKIRWAELANEYLMAKLLIKKQGTTIELEKFYQKRLAQPFIIGQDTANTNITLASYDSNETWGDFKFMTVDVQKHNFLPYVIRVWQKNGASRKLKHGIALGFAELDLIQAKYGVKNHCVFLDCGDRQTEVFVECCKRVKTVQFRGKPIASGWIALKGDKRREFPHPDKTFKYYNTELRGDPKQGIGVTGVTCPLYYWSNRSIKDILFHLRDGKGAPWLSNEDDPEYTKQLNAEVLKTSYNKYGKPEQIYVQKENVPNHFLDCEAMQIVAACLVGIIGNLAASNNDPVLDKPIEVDTTTQQGL